MGTCASQQGTEQKTRATRERLQVDTLHAQYVLTNGSSALQVEHRFQNDASAPISIPRPLLPLPAAPDALLTGLAFLLLARLVLERSAQAGGLSLLLRHSCRLPSRLAQRSPLRLPPRPGVWPGARPRPCVPPPSPPVNAESSASTSIAPASTSFLSAGCSMSCEDICPLFRGPRCNLLPRGRGMLRGFPVLLVTVAMAGSFSPHALTFCPSSESPWTGRSCPASTSHGPRSLPLRRSSASGHALSTWVTCRPRVPPFDG